MTDVIYRPAGRALEYCDLALNVYLGCPHQCLYCYVGSRFGGQPAEAKPRQHLLMKLRGQLERGKTLACHEVLLSFISDPYPPIEEELRLTRACIEMLHEYGLKVRLLTKAGLRATRDFDLLGDGDWFGVTLTFTDAEQSAFWEPGAAFPDSRIASIEAAAYKGIKTWVSLEPVIDPEATLEIIRQTHNFITEYKVGKLNHHPHAASIDWPKFAREAKALLDDLGCKYYLKRDLAMFLKQPCLT